MDKLLQTCLGKILNHKRFLGFKNILLYLFTNLGTPIEVVNQTFNVDLLGRNMFHLMLFQGNYDCVISVLNIHRTYLKKTLYDQLIQEKQNYRFKNMDIKHGKLVETVFHDAETVARHESFNIRVHNLLEQYSRDIIKMFN